MASEAISASLASNLLHAELEADRNVSQRGGMTWKTGNITLDNTLPINLWSGGQTIGIGSVDDARTMKNSPSSSISLELIATQLLNHHSTSNTPSSVFVICPPTQTTSTIHRLHSTLSRRQSHLHKSRLVDPKTLLAGISLLQYLDISGLLDSLTEVSTTLTQRHHQRAIILLQGLCPALTMMQRRSGTVQTAAMMTSVEQALGRLNARRMCLCLVELDGRRAKENDGGRRLVTAFSAENGNLKLDIHPVLGDLVWRTMDVLVLVHDAEGKVDGKKGKVVEVVKDDRVGVLSGSAGDSVKGEDVVVGSALGKWVVWE